MAATRVTIAGALSRRPQCFYRTSTPAQRAGALTGGARGLVEDVGGEHQRRVEQRADAEAAHDARVVVVQEAHRALEEAAVA